MNRTKLALAFTLIFLVGAAAGAAGGVAYAWHHLHHAPPSPEEIASHVGARLQRRLQLDPQQLERIRPILLGTGAQIGTIHQETSRRVREIFAEADTRIDVELTPEQRQKFEQVKRDRRPPPW